MSVAVLEVDLPSTLTTEEAKTLLAVKLYEVSKISLGQAAKMAGFSKRAFLEILDRYKVSVFNYPAEDLREELGL
jgi:predicted HTH domain antitoxin